MKKTLLITAITVALCGFCAEKEATMTADVSDANAQFEMGERYANGIGVATNCVEAAKWYRMAAEQGHTKAQREIGFVYADGKGVDTNVIEAVKWFRKAAWLGDDVAKLKYSKYCCDALTHAFISTNYSDSDGNISDSSKQVFLSELKRLWTSSGIHFGVPNDAISYIQSNLQSVTSLDFTDTGISASEAVKWLESICNEKGCLPDDIIPVISLNIASVYANGTGVEKYLKKAVEWLGKAADAGVPFAQFWLACCYAEGEGVEKDLEEAVKWCRKAAEQGLADAQYNLGTNYENGNGVEKNEAEAAKWYRKAAEQGDADAQYALGLCYGFGRGVEKNEVEAAKWYRKAAEQGLADAQYNLTKAQYNHIKNLIDRRNKDRLSPFHFVADLLREYPIPVLILFVIILGFLVYARSIQGNDKRTKAQIDSAIGFLIMILVSAIINIWLESAAEKNNALAETYRREQKKCLK